MQPAAAPASSSDTPGAVLLVAGLVSGVFVVTVMVAVSLTLRYMSRQSARRRAAEAAEERERQQGAELQEGEAGPVKIPVIVVLPDNKLRFGWEVPSSETVCDLDRYPSSDIKSSLGDDEAAGDLAERGEGSVQRAAQCRPPFASIQVHLQEEKL
ncbi:hypothetical protein N2152v2_005326 [Parachlorella kessleri]